MAVVLILGCPCPGAAEEVVFRVCVCHYPDHALVRLGSGTMTVSVDGQAFDQADIDADGLLEFKAPWGQASRWTLHDLGCTGRYASYCTARYFRTEFRDGRMYVYELEGHRELALLDNGDSGTG